MKERDINPNILVPKENTAATVMAGVISRMHPPIHVAAIAAVYTLGEGSSTVDIAEALDILPTEAGLYNSLYLKEQKGINPVVRDKVRNAKIQAARFHSEAKRLYYPQLCTLAIHWLAEHQEFYADGSNTNIFYARHDHTMSNHIGVMIDLYLEDDRLSQLTKRETTMLEQMKKYSQSDIDRRLQDNSYYKQQLTRFLRETGLATQDETDKNCLTDKGKSFIDEVIIPYVSLLVDTDNFVTNPQYETARRKLLFEQKTFNEDSLKLRNRLKKLGPKLVR